MVISIKHRLTILFIIMCSLSGKAQINTGQVMNIGRNALYFEDYILSIQYFNQVIKVKPYLAEPYFFRAMAKLYLEDYRGAEEDCNLAIERNPFITDAYQIRGIARQTLKKYKEAISDYTKGLELMPEHKVFLMNKAVAEETIKDYDASEKTYRRLISIYPNYENAYLGRSQLYLSKGDTLKALEDVNKSISLGKNNANAYVMRADINMKYSKDFKSALADMDEAIKLEPHFAGYFVNRAYLKYNLDDYFGAMSDFDYAIGLDPSNVTAHFNRGLLLAEVKDNNKAIDDFSFVIKNDPDNLFARYNRAILYSKTGQHRKAILDYDAVLAQYPSLGSILYERSESKRAIGDIAGGERDYNRARALMKDKKSYEQYKVPDDAGTSGNTDTAASETEKPESEEAVINKFKNLLTIENDNRVKPEYDSKTRGRIQDTNVSIDPEPLYFLSYYDKKRDLKDNTNYTKELDEVNSTHILPYVLLITNADTRLMSDQINRHFTSIDYYTGLLSGNSKPRSIDYFARAMEYMMVKNPTAAIADLTKAIAISPNFALAYMARANATYMLIEADQAASSFDDSTPSKDIQTTAMLKERVNSQRYSDILKDLDKLMELSPKMVYGLFNKGNIYLMMQDNTAALSCFNKAIEIKPDFGEAYYNRGLVYLRLGNKEKGVADLSKAGELGILPSYNVLKRMTN